MMMAIRFVLCNYLRQIMDVELVDGIGCKYVPNKDIRGRIP